MRLTKTMKSPSKLAILLQASALLFTARSTSAFAPSHTAHPISSRPIEGFSTGKPSSSRSSSSSSIGSLRILAAPTLSSTRGLTVLQSAKIFPIAYTSIGATLLYRAVQATTVADTAVLAATGAIALFNLGPTDNVRLASAKAAYAKTPPASSGKAKQLRQAARTWRSVVRIKLVGQFVGLVWMAVAAAKINSPGILRGAATIMAANMAYFLCGAGGAQHDYKGDSAPMPPGTASAILAMNTVLSAAALLAASSPLAYTRRKVCTGIYAVGVGFGAMEGLANLLSGRKRRREGDSD